MLGALLAVASAASARPSPLDNSGTKDHPPKCSLPSGLQLGPKGPMGIQMVNCQACPSGQGVKSDGYCGGCPKGEGILPTAACGPCPAGQAPAGGNKCEKIPTEAEKAAQAKAEAERAAAAAKAGEARAKARNDCLAKCEQYNSTAAAGYDGMSNLRNFDPAKYSMCKHGCNQ